MKELKKYLQIFILITLTSCSYHKENNRGINYVFIDGEKVKINPSPLTFEDSAALHSFVSDTSYIHNQKVKGMEGSGIIQLDTLHTNKLPANSKTEEKH